jgi:hypothetical protein
LVAAGAGPSVGGAMVSPVIGQTSPARPETPHASVKIFCLAGKALTLSMLRNTEPTIAGLDCSPAVKKVLRRAVTWDPEAWYVDAGAMVSAGCGDES